MAASRAKSRKANAGEFRRGVQSHRLYPDAWTDRQEQEGAENKPMCLQTQIQSDSTPEFSCISFPLFSMRT